MKLIIRADDLGISEAVNHGIKKAIVDGKVSAVGLMPNMDTAQHGFELIKDEDICLGQHTNICLGKPISDPQKIKTLVDQNGEFYSSKIINQRKIDTIDILECEIEIEAQLNRFIEITGKNPDYFEGHAVFSFNYLTALQNVAKRNNLFYVNPMDESWNKEYNIQGLDFIPLDSKGLYDPRDYLQTSLKKIKKYDCCIGVFHPGYLDQFILEHSSYTVIRPMECDFLCSDWLKRWLEDNKIEVVDFTTYNR